MQEHKKYNLSFKNKLLLGFFFIGTTPSLLFGGLIYSRTSQHMARSIRQDIMQSIERVEREIEILSVKSEISLEHLLESVQVLKEKNINNFSIVDAQGTPLYMSEQSTRYPIEEIVNRNISEGLVMIDEEENYFVYQLNHDLEIGFIIIAPVKVLFKEILEINGIFIKSSLIIITLSICFSIGISYKFIEGIKRLLSYVEKAKTGNFNFEVEIINQDEIGILTHSFKEMKEELNNLIEKTYKLEISEQDARLKALQAQISPHFLYNALDMVNWSLIENEDFNTSNIVIALSSILRYSIDDTKRYVTIKEEITQVNNYLVIQKSRFEERLNYEIIITDHLMDYSIPKLILQPIVENAVIHGVENRSRRGLVRIYTEETEEEIIFSIEDNGLGIKPERLEKLKQKMVLGNKIVDEDNKVHIGLANVNQRILLSYGKGYKVSIESKVDVGTTIRLNIKKRLLEDENTNSRR